jgi:hypothetical protein
MGKERFIKKILVIEIIGYALILAIVWMNEVFDLPHTIFGVNATPPNHFESLFESILILFLAVITLTITHAILKRLNFLEGLLPICSICKKIRSDQDWIPIEEYISSRSNANFTHGICPDCTEKYYGRLFKDKKS